MDYNITYREKDGGWQYIISCKVNGKWKQVKSKQGFDKSREGKKSCKEAAEKALEVLKEQSIQMSSEYKGTTFKEFTSIYIKHITLYKEVKSVDSMNTAINRFSDLNDMELTKITNIHIQNIVDGMAKEKLNPNTIKSYTQKLSTIFNLAINQYNIIVKNPVNNVKIADRRETVKKALTDKEIDELLGSIKDSRHYLIIYIAVNTGMRIGEICGLTWDDIDFNKYQISVNKQWKKNKDGINDFGKLKSKNSNRIIPISKQVAKEIQKHRNINSRVCPYSSSMLASGNISCLLKWRGFNITIHELRHTYATKLIANGLDIKTVANILGHDVLQTMKTYAHVNNDMLTNARNLIENIF